MADLKLLLHGMSSFHALVRRPNVGPGIGAYILHEALKSVDKLMSDNVESALY